MSKILPAAFICLLASGVAIAAEEEMSGQSASDSSENVEQLCTDRGMSQNLDGDELQAYIDTCMDEILSSKEQAE